MRLALLLIAIMVAALACDFETTSCIEPSSQEEKCLTVSDPATDTGEYDIKYVVGEVRNACDKVVGYVQVTINLYDDSGAQAGSTLANVNNPESGGVWKFKTVILEDAATRFKVAEVTGF